ncbi:MAG: hypothetical protein JHC61_08045 [Burkholderiaceae bacterium]|nr:hypothetical protein [Burkholderiaceae bacterium]
MRKVRIFVGIMALFAIIQMQVVRADGSSQNLLYIVSARSLGLVINAGFPAPTLNDNLSYWIFGNGQRADNNGVEQYYSAFRDGNIASNVARMASVAVGEQPIYVYTIAANWNWYNAGDTVWTFIDNHPSFTPQERLAHQNAANNMYRNDMWISRSRILNSEVSAYRVYAEGVQTLERVRFSPGAGEFRHSGAQIYYPIDSLSHVINRIYTTESGQILLGYPHCGGAPWRGYLLTQSSDAPSNSCVPLIARTLSQFNAYHLLPILFN